jgi:hypothetical protein
MKYYIPKGPIILLGGYTRFGISWTFAITTLAMITPMILLFTIRERILSKTETPETLQMTEIKSEKS